MFRKLSCGILVLSLFVALWPSTAPAGVEPTPWKLYLAETVELIISRLSTPTGGPGDPDPIISRLKAIADPARNVTNTVLARNVLGVMERITRISFDPQPEPPGMVAFVLNQLITLGFETPPEKLSLATETSRLMDRITARFFDPQPEPPGIVQFPSNILYILSGISTLTNSAASHEQNSAKSIIGILSRVDEILFDPQPEPPGRFTVPLISIFDQMADLYGILNSGPIGTPN